MGGSTRRARGRHRDRRPPPPPSPPVSYLLKAALERGIFLDVLAVFVERRRADAAQLAAAEHRLEQVARVHRATRRARADDGVDFVNEEDDLAGRLGHLVVRRGVWGSGSRPPASPSRAPPLAPFADLFDDRFQAVLKLAPVLGPRDERPHVERHEDAVLERGRNVARDDPLRQPLGHRRLAHPRLPDQHRVVLGPARQNLHAAPNLVVAPDDGVELALARGGGQVARVLGQRLVLALRVLVRHLVGPAHLLDGGLELGLGHAGGGQEG